MLNEYLSATKNLGADLPLRLTGSEQSLPSSMVPMGHIPRILAVTDRLNFGS